MRILLIEDEPELSSFLCNHLKVAGYIIDAVKTIEEAQAASSCHRYDFSIVDRYLPDGDGIKLIPVLKNEQPTIQILVVTACAAVAERIYGLDSGADDYISKPFDIDELTARLRACLRRSSKSLEPNLVLGAICYDLHTRQVLIRDNPFILQRRELLLLECLMRRAGRVVLRDHVFNSVYGIDDLVQFNALNILVSRLRKKLTDVSAGVEIHSVRGIGYMICKAPTQ
jgi:DNA-binding response OmpR family regulator